MRCRHNESSLHGGGEGKFGEIYEEMGRGGKLIDDGARAARKMYGAGEDLENDASAVGLL